MQLGVYVSVRALGMGWLPFGGEQHGVMLEMIDDTYKYGFERKDIARPGNFGGYPHGYFLHPTMPAIAPRLSEVNGSEISE